MTFNILKAFKVFSHFVLKFTVHNYQFLGITSRIEEFFFRIAGKIIFMKYRIRRIDALTLKGPKHDQVGYEFFYIKQTRMVR
jgi:hypothetical protein